MTNENCSNSFYQVSRFLGLASNLNDVTEIRDGLHASHPRVIPTLEWASGILTQRNLNRRLNSWGIRSVKNLSEIPALIPHNTKVISFDFFDTLATRVGVTPQMVTQRASEFLGSLLLGKGALVTVEDLILRRRVLESNLRANSVRLHFRDPETTITAICTNILGYVDEEIVSRGVRFEVELEKNALYLVKDAERTLAKLTSLGFTLVLTSEMYLEEPHIRDIAANLGIEQYFSSVFVSSSSKWMKGSGRLYSFLAKELEVDFSEVLHIGDNPHADIFPVENLGMSCIHLARTEVEPGQNLPLDVWTYTRSLLSSAFGVAATPNASSKQLESDALTNLVGEKIAPILALFIQDIWMKAISLNLDHVYFIAREGIVLRALYEKFVSGLAADSAASGLAKPSSVLHVNRKTALALEYPANGSSGELLRISMERTPSLEIDDLLAVWAISKTELSSGALDEYQRMREDYPAEFFHESLFQLLDNPLSIFGKEFRSVLALKRNQVLSYLRHEGLFDHERIGLVDLGWVGTIPVALGTSIFEQNGSSNIASFLLATSPGHRTKGLDSLANHIAFPGYAIDGGRNPLSFVLLADCAGPLEVLFGSDEVATTNGYVQMESNWTPDLASKPEPNPKNIEVQKTVATVAQEIVQRLAGQLTNARLDYETLRKVNTDKFIQFLSRPTVSESQSLEGCTLDMGDVGNNERPLVSRIKLSRFFRTGLVNGESAYIWVRGTFSISKYPEFFFRVYEGAFLIQYLGLSVMSVIRRILKWSPF